MNRFQPECELEDKDETTEVFESEAFGEALREFLENLCGEDEFSILRETLRLYKEEVTIH